MNNVTLKNTTTADSLRELADFLDANPDLDERASISAVYLSSFTEDEFRETNQALGNFEKKTDSYGLEAVKRFGSIRLVHYIAHEAMCEKKVVGTKVVKKMVPKQAQPDVEMIEVEEIEEITEWVCPETWR